MAGVHSIVPALILAGISANLHAAEFGLVSGREGDDPSLMHVMVHLYVDSGENVAGLQFDLLFNSEVLRFQRASAGLSASNAAKDIHFNELRNGEVRVIVAGLNRNVLESGTVAVAHFELLDGNASAEPLELRSVVLSDPFGTPVPVIVLEPSASSEEIRTRALAAQTSGKRGSVVPVALFGLLMGGVTAAVLQIVRRKRRRK